ncbi:hypothetical protein Tco_0621677 [Tanacetum coccineum]
MASMNTRLNIEKLDGNIVQKHGGSKQVGFKQLGPGVETGVHGVHDEKRVWFEVELQGAQGDREAEVFQVSNDDTAVAQRWLEDKQPEEKTNTDCLVKEQEKEYQTGWKIKTGNVLDSCNQRSTQQFWSVQGSLGRGYNHVYISSEQGNVVFEGQNKEKLDFARLSLKKEGFYREDAVRQDQVTREYLKGRKLLRRFQIGWVRSEGLQQQNGLVEEHRDTLD